MEGEEKQALAVIQEAQKKKLEACSVEVQEVLKRHNCRMEIRQSIQIVLNQES